jgi:hypothetical protein
MRGWALAVCSFLLPVIAFSQAGTGTIKGTITDPAGAVVANVAVEARNIETGVQYSTQSTGTGNYTLTQLPPGSYEVAVTAPGFKKFIRSGLTVQVAQILPVDIALVLGAPTDSVTVTAEATLLKTESGDLAHNITVQSLDELPILGIGGTNAGSSGIRNPYALANLIPGVDYVANNTMVVNGAPNNTAGYRIEGQDMTNHFVSFALQEMQPSADAIQEVAVQTSNYAPEFGVAGGGLFNITMKSGTNQYHGTAYDYFVNEDLNAAYPFTISENGHKVRPRSRRNDYGGTMGGPVRIPRLYDGHNKTFFFFNWEEYLESTGARPSLTVPTSAYRNGDFSSISVNGGAGFNTGLGVPTAPLPSVDGLGRPIYANTIYDPDTERTGNNGVPVRDAFPNNVIPQSRFDPIALKIQSLFPLPSTSNTTNNAVGSYLSQRTTIIPSLKIDESIRSNGKLSFFWSKTYTDSQYSSPNGNADGLPPEITQARGTFFHYYVTRLNYDHTLTPTLLLHAGAGYSQIYAPDDAPFLNFNAQKELGLSGFQINRNFPYISGMCAALLPGQAGTCAGNLGGMQTVGTAMGIQGHPHPQNKPTANANLTWVRESHTYKAGAEAYWQGSIQQPFPAVLMAAMNTANPGGATGLPFSPPLGYAGSQVGFGYANFLLGDFVNIQQNTGADYRLGKSQWGLFVQDGWKVTRKVTFDYGVRWDYGTYAREEYGRSANLGVNVPDPAAGGHLGGTIFEATCHCRFARNYPYAIAPRLGLAWQIAPRTVLRAGWGLVYSFTPEVNGSAALSASNAPSSPGGFVNIETPGVIPQPRWPVFDPGLYPNTPGSTNTGPQALDPNAGRPARQNQWSIGLQRELSSNVVIEASYVGNRGVWWPTTLAGSGVNLGLLEQISPARFAAYGLDPYRNAADNQLLSSPINSTAVVNRLGYIPVPYQGFPLTGTLLNALRPFPQYSTAGVGNVALALSDVPTGKTWYDSLQAKLTKRYSHGLQASGTFTWSKALINTREDFFNPASSSKNYETTDQPFLINANIVYTTPKIFAQRLLSQAVRDWQFGAFVQYGSGFPLTPPNSTATNTLASANGATNYMVRVPGVPLYLKDLNCHCVNPYTDQVLNPAAWTNPPVGTWGGNALFGDFRAQRRPQENFNIGRIFRFKERMSLQIRAEFVNIFNRTYLGNPSTTSNPQNPLSRNGLGQLVSGFGVINETLTAGATASIPSNGGGGQLYYLPRTGTLIARFTF